MKLICLLMLLASFDMEATKANPATAEPLVESKSRFAMLDDVRLLANGLLHLGQSLKEFVQKTKGQINDIFQKLDIFDHSFYQLSVVTSEIKEEEEELKKTTSLLKTNNEEIKNLSLEMNTKVNDILQERNQLQTKVGGLEEKLSGLAKSVIPPEQLRDITALKEVIEAQEKNIQTLLFTVQGQQDQLNYQSKKIKSLEEKLSYEMLQETAEKLERLNPRASSLTEHLNNTSSNTSSDTYDLPADCNEVFNRGERISGVYSIKPNNSDPFNVFCEMTADGGSTVIQRRQDGSVDFDQTWEKYENGFGELQREFWLGLKKIHSIVFQSSTILQIQLEDWKGDKRSIEYQFAMDGPSSQYTIHLRQVSGDLPNAMANHTGMRFSTKDHDNDNDDDFNCAENYTGGWWFSACGDTNLNGKYMRVKPKGRAERRSGIYWRPERGNAYSIKSTKLSIRQAPDDSGFH
ncbi:angiopoietin-related protein 3 [Scleropages formosus]|uniref:Angiopoietin-like 3 n=1 Tax=Scleropages formosus TaxID=113540 RepID=A0A8C9QZM2_SCLFO|nr:angiopoietin-related protein 3 [Scleropages formosus]